MGWVLYSTKWVKSVLYGKPQHKTQAQHTTTNMSRRRPTLQRCLLSLSMGRLSAPPTNGAAASYRSHVRHPWSGLAAWWLVCLFGAPKRDASKNREMGGALDLGDRRLMMAYNNQLESAKAIMGMLERRHVGGRVHGETPFHRLGRRIERQKINKHEIHHGLRQLLINNGSHSNQPKTGSRDGWKYGGEVQRVGRVEEVRYHHFGGIVSWIAVTQHLFTRRNSLFLNSLKGFRRSPAEISLFWLFFHFFDGFINDPSFLSNCY